jgi:glutamate--cysteine ligase
MPFTETPFDSRLITLSSARNLPLFCSILRGIEREGLRVDSSGNISQSPHPKALGSALTHPYITTDYSEALLEFITEPSNSIADVLQQLRLVIGATSYEIGDEIFWAGSMPCQLGADTEIPVARYGHSNTGRMKEVYRLGLGHRYSRKMQTIAGVHFNYSLPDAMWNVLRRQDQSNLALQDYKTEGYFAIIRNFRRWLWLLLYLMGSAPAVCRSFVKDREHQLEQRGEDTHTLCTPNGTSLRMGDLGYQSLAQNALTVCYNSLESYIEILRDAILTEIPEYEELGLLDEEGNHQQLNAGLLQIENEFYSTIRPKQTARRGETQLKALSDRGVEYVEIRCLDLNPFDPLGISEEQVYFVEAFLLTCLLTPSPMTENEEYAAIQENQNLAVYQGRNPEINLTKGDGSSVSLQNWGREIFDSIIRSADLLDQATDTAAYSKAVNQYALSLDDPNKTPSATILRELEKSGSTYHGWTMEKSKQAMQRLQEIEISDAEKQRLVKIATKSFDDQAEIEVSDSLDFDTYLSNYFEQYRNL